MSIRATVPLPGGKSCASCICVHDRGWFCFRKKISHDRHGRFWPKGCSPNGHRFREEKKIGWMQQNNSWSHLLKQPRHASAIGSDLRVRTGYAICHKEKQECQTATPNHVTKPHRDEIKGWEHIGNQVGWKQLQAITSYTTTSLHQHPPLHKLRS